jgi:YD repeat-containing protein
MISQINQTPPLVGKWRQITSNKETDGEETTMVFTLDGKLIYSIDTDDRTQIINLVYETFGDTLITDQPSAPKKEYSQYYFESDDLLILDYDGEKTKFQRVK